jgi:GxxExxY protein
METNKLTEKIIGCCVEVHRNLGPGLLESAYEEALCFELMSMNLEFKRQQLIPLEYKGHKIYAGFRADIIVEDQIVLEIKSTEKNHPVYSKQLLTYLKLTGKRYGLLINFNVVLLKDGIERIVNGY